MFALRINNLSHKINNNNILQNISLEIEDDKIACILGPSGCGKTTLLKLIAGLENIQEGKIYIKPTRSLEFISVEFLITPTGASFENI